MSRHRSEVSKFKDMAPKWIDRWLENKNKLKELKKENLSLSMDLRELNKLKLQLKESLLEQLEQLKKAMDDIAILEKLLSDKEPKIASLRSLITRDKEEIHAPKVRLRELELGTERDEGEKERL